MDVFFKIYNFPGSNTIG